MHVFAMVGAGQGLAEANALLTRVLALHFAGDASSPGLGGGNLRRACCSLAFQDAVDVRVSSELGEH